MSTCPVAHDYDPLAPDTLRDPYSELARLRGEGPVVYLPEVDHYLVTRYDECVQVLQDRDTYSAANASTPLNPPCPAAAEVLTNGGYKRVPTLNNADPPRHGHMRKTVLACMTPRKLRELEPALRSYAEGLVDDVKDEDEFDLVDRIAFPFPGYAAFTLLGFPPEDTEQLKTWSHNRVLLTYGRLTEAAQVAAAQDVVGMWKYAERHIEQRMAEPADDLTSDLLAYAAKHAEHVTPFDVTNMVYAMALAGHETTCNAIGNSVFQLLTYRDQWERLVADPALCANAADEALRFDGPVISQRRVAKVDTVLAGNDIPAGGRLMLCFASAGRDATTFANPDELHVDRDDAELHLAFGRGPHLCLGAPLARLEMQIVLELLTSRFPKLDLVAGQSLNYVPNVLFRGLQRLLVRTN